MIGKLRGVVDEINNDHIILDVGGVGYKIFLTTSTLAALSYNAPGVFNIEMIVREDQMLLYGFNSKLLAARIVNELKNHQEISAAASTMHIKTNISVGSNAGAMGSIFNDALNALATLGFSRSDAAKILSEVIQEHDSLSLEDAIRLSLSKMAPN